MITSSHIIYGWALAKASKRQPDKQRTMAFVIGSFLPDIPIYTFFFVHTLLLGTSQHLMWNELYFDSGWTVFFTLSHSLLLWPVVLLIGLVNKQKLLQYVSVAAVAHIVLDFFVHNDDAYSHFWPLSDWKFISPISYWDPQYYGHIVGGIDAVVIIGLLMWLGTIYQTKRMWYFVSISGLLYIASVIAPFFIF